MERLTERNKSGCAMAACCGKECEYNYVCEVGGFGECRGMDDIIDRLADIEDILGCDYDLDRLRELVEADRAGRVKILSSTTGMTCGACDHFKRIPGTCRGRCSERPYCRNKYGHTDERRGEFTPAQSRIACKEFERRKGPEGQDDFCGCGER